MAVVPLRFNINRKILSSGSKETDARSRSRRSEEQLLEGA